MPRPEPTAVLHFTRVEHLGTIVASGLQCDALVQASELLSLEVGDTDIKRRRSQRAVPVHPGGVVADFVPFYFAPRSPMMFSIARGNVPSYAEGTNRIAYLVSTVERLQQLGLEVLLTDRNAVLGYTEFARLADGEPPEDFVDWPLMRERYWYDTDDYPDRKEGRMAECLVHRAVPWSAFTDVVVKSEGVAVPVRAFLQHGGHPQSVSVRPNWYF